MAKKVRFGLRNVKYALWNESTSQYGALKDLPWAVNLSLSKEGGDSSDFWADDTVCFSFAGTNGGYSGDLEMANIPDSVRVDLLGETLDSGTGVQFEVTSAEPPEFALVFETQTDNNPQGFVMYNCKASRPGLNASTMTESTDVNTETIPLRISSREFTFNGEAKKFVQGHIHKTSENATQYTAFFASVVTPTATA